MKNSISVHGQTWLIAYNEIYDPIGNNDKSQFSSKWSTFQLNVMFDETTSLKNHLIDNKRPRGFLSDPEKYKNDV